jgi:hypothetical protein
MHKLKRTIFLIDSFLASPSTLKMEAVYSSQTSMFHSHRCESLKFEYINSLFNRDLLEGETWDAQRKDVEINCKCKKHESLQFGLSHLPYSLIPDVITVQCTQS